ncbi:glycoside hydrolase family 26 protein [Flavobacterium aquicola]|uniref:Mannan endo-1,4-beta-mannosidase n=1 Tax=Flavobacterium aquicola TaxID=1682742 RepID=A0A3E0EAZ8_9FLAO|nr:glycosyl hydrolase [Flavobacterium aquicola]REG94800.1 mannan endo-1,4-beta-mannosidase [Flavobacterium aquicola]
MKSLYAILVTITLLSAGCSSSDHKEEQNGNDPDVPASVTLQLTDPNATAETKALYSNLWRIQEKGTMFGHHDDLLYGRNWITESGRSDIKDVCGDYPGVFSVDFAEIMDDRSTTATLNNDRIRVIKEARERGEVITACCHLNNPLTGGDSWDNSKNTVAKEILTDGSATNLKFNSWLDKLAVFANNLKDSNGKLIPVIFRPFHEHTQTWSWWGSSATTQQEFISLWKYTIDYLKNKKQVHSFIYAISPQLDQQGTVDSFLFRWPGDNYVDFIGWDSYHGTNTAAFSTNLRNLASLSQQKLKPCGVTETGIEGIVKNGAPYDTYWTNEISIPLSGKKVSLVIMWRNKYDPSHEGSHFYAPFKEHSSAANFKMLYASPNMIFSKKLPNMYSMAANTIVK